MLLICVVAFHNFYGDGGSRTRYEDKRYNTAYYKVLWLPLQMLDYAFDYVCEKNTLRGQFGFIINQSLKPPDRQSSGDVEIETLQYRYYGA